MAIVERTLAFVKPDGVQRRLVGKIVARFEARGFKILGLKMMQVSRDLAERHYAEHKGKKFYDGLMGFVTSGPIVAMCLEGNHAVRCVREMMGKTFGFDAAPGTIRGDFGLSNSFNLIHGSDSLASAAREIELYFKPEELVSYDISDQKWMTAD